MLCLFDLDGTLIDSELGITSSIKHALEHLDVPAPLDLRSWIGPPLRVSFAPLLGHDAERVEAAVDHYHDRFSAIGWQEHSVYPGVGELIVSLHEAGHTLAVVTSKPLEHAAPIVESLPFGNYFARIYGPDPSSPLSEKASMIANALMDFEMPAHQAVMVGDRHFDIEGAVANGVAGIGVLWGFGSREELEQAGAYAVVVHPEHVVTVLRNIHAA
jgi:phosphoglycolate phosphatase